MPEDSSIRKYVSSELFPLTVVLVIISILGPQQKKFTDDNDDLMICIVCFRLNEWTTYSSHARSHLTTLLAFVAAQLFSALSIGCVNKLTSLDVSRCVYSYKKLSRDVVVPMHWKDFFTKAVALQSVNFAGCRLPSEAVKYVFFERFILTSGEGHIAVSH